MTTRPEVAVRRQPRIVSSVVLPDPEGPSRATISAGSSDRETPLRIGTVSVPSRNDLVKSWASRTGMGRGPPAIQVRGRSAGASSSRVSVALPDKLLPAEHQGRVEAGYLAERQHRGPQAEGQGAEEDADDEAGADDQLQVDARHDRLQAHREQVAHEEADHRRDRRLFGHDAVDIAVGPADGLDRRELLDVLHGRGVE